jgi:CubicO group peptidase (beta-lactamase class C family)
VSARVSARETRDGAAHLRRLARRTLCAVLAAASVVPALAQAQRTPRRDARTIARLRDSVQAVLARGLAAQAYPGAIAVIGSGTRTYATVAVGRLDAADATVPDAHTRWDLASLTKVVGTTTLVLQLVDQGRVALDTPMVRYLPGWRGERVAGITVRHLLTHSSGLPAWRSFHKEADDAAEARQQLLLVSPEVAPGTRYRYSDIGFLLLGRMVEELTGTRLDSAFAARVAAPLGLRETGWLPAFELRPTIAPTEFDSWRQRKVHGEVHDENAYRFGGVAGHAGLFSTAADMARIARLWLGGGAIGGTRLARRATVAQFTRAQDTLVSRRALGWETPTGTNSAGTRLSARAFGHTGFTGTSMWMDPDKDLFIVLLTNRVNPTRENSRIGGVRTGLADAVVGALEGATSAPVADAPAPAPRTP